MNFSKNYYWRHILFCSLLLFSIHTVAQENSNLKKLLDTTNSFYGPSDLLNVGGIYRPEHIYAKGHPYFTTDEYTLASLIVNNTTFNNIQARYNIATDQLIVKAIVDSGFFVSMVASDDWLSAFTINKHSFVSLNKRYPGKELKGYCEQVYDGDKSFYIKYKKEFVNTYDANIPAGFFTELKSNKYIYTKGAFISINKKKDFYKLYSDKKSIKKYLRENKVNYSKASSYQLKALMKFCDGLPK